MKTSYYGRINSKLYKGFAKYGVQISANARYWNGPKYEPLFPTWDMIRLEDEEEYERRYRAEILDKLDPLEVYNDLGENAILLCYESIAKIESGETFCHRHIVAKWLEEELAGWYDINITIDELGESDLKAYKFDKNSLKYKTKNVNKQLSLFD